MDQQPSSTPDIQVLSDKEIFTKIWTSPRLVFQYINERHYDKYVAILLIIAGIARAFDRAATKNLGDTLSLWVIIGGCIVLGGLLGWLSFYIYAALLSWTGKWLHGKGNTTSILRVLAYAMIPLSIALVLIVPQIGIYGIEIFKSDGDITSAGLLPNFFFYGAMILEAVLGIWAFVLCVVGISEVQKLSIGNAVLNIFLPVLIIVVPIALLYFFFFQFI
ncbi:Yip1 family protein [Sediminicola sp. 1XM1-17]|uniref:Yip1 family protein n=1 Tax=Sediminicola sp. 1XM1-17 TaxID=3127702 RepID=UPI003077A1FC